MREISSFMSHLKVSNAIKKLFCLVLKVNINFPLIIDLGQVNI